MAEESGREHQEHQRTTHIDHEAGGAFGGQEGLGLGDLSAYPDSLLGDPRMDGRGNRPVKQALVQRMQQTYGNRAVQRFLQRASTTASPLSRESGMIQRHVDAAGERAQGGPQPATREPVQRKLDVSTPGDSHEREAEAAADAVVRGEPATVSLTSPPAIARDQPPGAKPDDKDKKDAPKGVDASMLDVQGGDIGVTGKVTAKPAGDNVDIESPGVKYEATVTLKSGVTLGPDAEPVMVGPIQTLMGSERVGVYRKDGAKNGEIMSEEHMTVGQTRDAQWDKSKKGGQEQAVPAPWYSQPTSVSDNNPGRFTFFDKPGFELPRQVGKGKLTETRGADKFLTSLGAKRGGQLIHLKQSHWEVPWDINISDQFQGQGNDVTSGASKDAPPTTDGPIAVNAGKEWMAFKTVEAALAASNDMLMTNLVPAKANDKDAYDNIVAALKQKNPSLTLTVKVESTADAFSSDEIMVRLKGSKQAQRDAGNINDGGTATVSFKLNEVLDVGAIDASTALQVEVQDMGWISHDPGTLSWPYPFAGQADAKRLQGGGGGKYTVKGSLQ